MKKRTKQIIGVGGISIIIFGLLGVFPYVVYQMYPGSEAIWWHVPLGVIGSLAGICIFVFILHFIVNCLADGFSKNKDKEVKE